MLAFVYPCESARTSFKGDAHCLLRALIGSENARSSGGGDSCHVCLTFFKVGSRLCSQVRPGASYVAQAGLKLDPPASVL